MSGGQQRDPAIDVHVFILPQTPLPSRLPHNIKQISLCYTVKECVHHLVMSDSATQWAGALQASLPMGFSRQGYWSGLPCPPPGDLPDPGTEPGFLSLQADSLPFEPRTFKVLYRKVLNYLKVPKMRKLKNHWIRVLLKKGQNCV